MSHYSEYRERDAFEARERERLRVAKVGSELLEKARTISTGAHAPSYVHDSIDRLRGSILLWMDNVGALKVNGD